MPKFKLRAEATVSCYTEVEADTLEEAIKEAAERELAGLCAYPFTGQVSEEWYFQNDGAALNITADD